MTKRKKPKVNGVVFEALLLRWLKNSSNEAMFLVSLIGRLADFVGGVPKV